MALDFRHGLLPSGADPADCPNVEGLPFPIEIDHTTDSVATIIGSFRPLIIPGRGDVRLLPQALVSIAYACEWEFTATLEGDGTTATWSGTLKRGLTREKDDADPEVITGTAITTLHEAFSRGLSIGGVLRYPEQNAIWQESDSTGGGSSFSISIDAIDAFTYYPVHDVWIVQVAGVFGNGISVNGNVSRDTEDAVPVAVRSVAFGGDSDVIGATFCGAAWQTSGSNVTAFTLSATPTVWLS